MEQGYIIIARKIRESRSYSRGVEYGGLMLELLLRANHKAKFCYGMMCERGQLIVSVVKLAETLKLSRSKTNRMLKHLANDKFLILKADSKKTVVTICNYDTYQDFTLYKQTASEQPADSERTTNEQPADTNNTLKELNKYIYSVREQKFIDKYFSQEVIEALQVYADSFFETHHRKIINTRFLITLKNLKELPKEDHLKSVERSTGKWDDFYTVPLDNETKKTKLEITKIRPTIEELTP